MINVFMTVQIHSAFITLKFSEFYTYYRLLVSLFSVYSHDYGHSKSMLQYAANTVECIVVFFYTFLPFFAYRHIHSVVE